MVLRGKPYLLRITESSIFINFLKRCHEIFGMNRLQMGNTLIIFWTGFQTRWATLKKNMNEQWCLRQPCFNFRFKVKNNFFVAFDGSLVYMFIIHIFFKIVFLEKRQSEIQSFSSRFFFISAVLDTAVPETLHDTHQCFLRHRWFFCWKFGIKIRSISDTIDTCLLLKICKFEN